MSARDEVKAKLTTLNNRASDAHMQGLNPRDVPVTLSFAIDITNLLLKAIEEQAQQAKADAALHHVHSHVYKVGGHDKQTGLPQ